MKITTLVLATLLASTAISVAVARETNEGARGEGGKANGHTSIQKNTTVAKNGADDAPGDDRGGAKGGKGAGDGAGHTSIQKNTTVAKNGADDAPGDDRGNHGPNHG